MCKKSLERIGAIGVTAPPLEHWSEISKKRPCQMFFRKNHALKASWLAGIFYYQFKYYF